MTMRTRLCLDRNQWFWRGISPVSVGAFLKDLRQCRKRVQDGRFLFSSTVGLNEQRCDELLSLIDDEIRLGEFYFALRQRRRDPRFDRWVFERQEKRQDAWPWVAGDVWRRSNGRLKTAVVVDRSRVAVRVSLHVANDSEHLTFFNEQNTEVCHRYLRSETSIQEEVVRLKERAAALFAEHRFPVYWLWEHHLLRDLLHLRGGEDGR